MKKTLSLITASLLLTSAASALDLNIKNTWMMVGSDSAVETSKFDNTCIDFIWQYDTSDVNNPEWKIYVPQGTTYLHDFTEITSLTANEGFWVKGNGECSITVALSKSDFPNSSYDTSLLDGEASGGIGYTDPNSLGMLSFDTVSYDGTVPPSIFFISVDGVIAKLDVATEYTGNTFEVVTTDGVTYVGTFAAENDYASPAILTLKPITHNGVTYETFTSAETGRVWLDRNLGASQACTAIDDTACYGDYYQWGREADGHEKSDSTTTATQATSTTADDGSFISGSSDWTTVDSDGTLRTASWSKTDGTSVCPVGYRVPTKEEFVLEEAAFENYNEALATLKLPSSGYRFGFYGSLSNQGGSGYFWSSSVNSTSSDLLYFNSSNALMYGSDRAFGFPVRCIKD